MILYIAPTPLNKLDKKERVSGWHCVPLEKKAKQDWRAMLAQLKEKGVQRVLSSDLDQEAARIAGDELHVPVSTEYYLRRFNFGRFHATPLDNARTVLVGLEKRWAENPDIPIKEGDSLTSFMRRFPRRFNQLLSSTGTALLITDLLTIAFVRGGMDCHSLIPNGNPVFRGKIYKVTVRSNEQTHHAV